VSTERKLVPAVRHVLEIFDFLRESDNTPQSLTSIARGAGVNVSTCFNVLKTLESGGLIAFDPDTKEYRLGLRLAELGGLADGRAQSRRVAMREARKVSQKVGLGCFLIGFTHSEEFVVLDKADSTSPIRLTIDIGARFPAVGSLAAKAWFAWLPDEVVDDVVARHEFHAFTAQSITSPKVFKKELATVRKRGYAVSEGEYYPDHNAVAAPVFGWDGRPVLLFVVVGPRSRLAGPGLTELGEEIARAAASATASLHGRHPGESSSEEPDATSA
jgi:DNA-binding IclR family transcriptional regulator